MAFADHPHTDPGDGRSECDTRGKWIWPVTHSCKGVAVTDAARSRLTSRLGYVTSAPRKLTWGANVSTSTEPACILCWCRNRDTVAAAMFDGIAWYCDEHGEQVITDRLRPRWIRRLRWLAGGITKGFS